MSCPAGCFNAVIQSCNDIVIRAGFPPNYYLYWIVSKHGSSKRYQRLVQTGNNGDLTISKTVFPAGFFVNGKIIEIEVRNGSDYLQPVILVFDEIEYSCVMAYMKSIDMHEDDESPVNVIQSSVAAEVVGPGTGYLTAIASDDFLLDGVADATHADNPGWVGKQLAIFWNNIPRYLEPDEWELTPTGINILVPGFDATANTYSMYVYIIG